MTKRKYIVVYLLLAVTSMSACGPTVPTPIPGIVDTIVAATYAAASTQTAAALPTATATPLATPTPKNTPTNTPTPTATFLFVFTPTNTATLTPTLTPTREPLTEWPDWKTGTVVKVTGGGGGTYKTFDILKNVKMVVVRQNGVKLRSSPSKAVGGPMAAKGDIVTLTGMMNKNNEFGWLFAQVNVGGQLYWVGGSEDDDDTDPRASLDFYNP
ncbi:MAG: hypothetical protein GXP40_07785 [Chloroflexi bacterium]|nr:hypothetical protein [Chloroflexota bacterium]